MTEAESPQRQADAVRARNTRVTLAVLTVGLTVCAGLLFYNLQPCSVSDLAQPCTAVRTWEEYLLVNITGLMLVPIVSIFALPREGPQLFGWWRPRPPSWRMAGTLYLLMVVPLAIASRRPEFLSYYPLRPEAAYSWPVFWYHEATYGLYMLAWEFFFRGYLTFGLARRLSNATAVGIQAVLFGLMHYGKPGLEVAGSFLAGVVLGHLALRGRSFYHCFALHWACSVTFDVLVIWARPDGLW